MSTSELLEMLVSLRNEVKWEIKEERHKFLYRINRSIADWTDDLPNLRDVFRPEQIECLLLDSIDCLDLGEFTQFVARTGYKIEPDVDKDAEPIASRRTTLVHHAAKSRMGYLISDLLKIYDGSNVNYMDESGYTHFHAACEYGCADVVEKFLEFGQIDPNLLVSETSDSPLHLALGEKVVELLLRHGADPNLINKAGSTPLHNVCEREKSTEVFFAICDDCRTTVRVDVQDKLGHTPLQVASRYGHKKAIELLLRRGADASLANEEGKTPLHFLLTRFKDHGEMELFFEILKDTRQTVRINVPNKLGVAPLHLAIAHQDQKAVELILRNGADPNLANLEGLPPLQLIVQRYRNGNLAEKFFKAINEIGKLVEIDVRDNKNRTLLQWAVANLLPKLVRVLLQNGADLSNFVFPTEEDFDKHVKNKFYKLQEYDDYGLYACKTINGVKLEILSDAFEIIQHLERRGYQLERSDALTIMKLFAKNGWFEDLDESWTNDKAYEKKAKELKVLIPQLSIYDFMRLRPDEAVEMLTYTRYKLTQRTLDCLPSNVIEAAHKKLGTIMLRRFLRPWALECYMKLTQCQLPLECCEFIIDESLTNKNLFNICLAATGQSHKESDNNEVKFITKCNNKRQKC